MPVPRSRLSNARKNKRRAHHALKPVQFRSCPNCKKPQIGHHVCRYCGFYKGRSYGKKVEKTVE